MLRVSKIPPAPAMLKMDREVVAEHRSTVVFDVRIENKTARIIVFVSNSIKFNITWDMHAIDNDLSWSIVSIL
jgi:hypothetical protein